MERNEIRERLENVRKFLKIDVEEFSAALGYQSAKSYRSTLYQGKGVSTEQLQMVIKKYPEVNLKWLFDGEGSPHMKEYKINDSVSVVNEPHPPTRPPGIETMLREMHQMLQRIEAKLS